jgi:hypothetical protein
MTTGRARILRSLGLSDFAHMQHTAAPLLLLLLLLLLAA